MYIFYFGFGHQPSSIERVQQQHLSSCWQIMRRQLVTLSAFCNKWVIWKALSAWKWCQGNSLRKWKERCFVLQACVSACLPDRTCLRGGTCYRGDTTEARNRVWCYWAQIGALFSVELYPVSDLFWNLDLFVEYLNIDTETILRMHSM